MLWNWQLPEWPQFTFETKRIAEIERQFLLKIGSFSAYLKNMSQDNYNQFVVEILSQEGSGSSKIEGELLDRESLQSSIKRHFGLTQPSKEEGKKMKDLHTFKLLHEFDNRLSEFIQIRCLNAASN